MPFLLKKPVTQEDLANYLKAVTFASHSICDAVAACFFYDESGEQVFSPARAGTVHDAVKAAATALTLAEA